MWRHSPSVFATVLASPVPALAQLGVIISGGFFAAYKKLIPEFERTSGISVVTANGSSHGDGPTTIGAQLRSGVLFDVVILNTTGLADLMAQGRIVKGFERRFAQVLPGIGVRVRSAAPDVGTADALRQKLRLIKCERLSGRAAVRTIPASNKTNPLQKSRASARRAAGALPSSQRGRAGVWSGLRSC